MKSILVHIREDEGQQGRLEAATGIASAVCGSLSCLQVLPSPDLYPTHPLTSSHMMKLLHDTAVEIRKREAANRRHVEARLSSGAVRHDWIEYEGDAAAAIAAVSRFTDLAVVSLSSGRRSPSEPLPLAEELILSASVPIFAVPPALQRLDLTGTAVVAWNGSQQAARACRAAVPLLQQASRVVVITVGEGTLAESGEALCTYLARHGIEASARHEEARDVDAAILDMARAEDASWMAAGAYGHARWRETVFGGATKTLLESDARPVLMTG